MSKQSAAGTLDAGPVRVHAFTREYVRARSALFRATVSTRTATAQERRWASREVQGAEGQPVALTSLVFHRAGAPVGDFRKAWATACEDARLPGLLFHDLRRSAVREMDRAGVKQTVAMKITGHKTPSMWRRYRITSTEEVRDALALTQTAIRAQQDQARNVVELRPAIEGRKA